MSVTIEFWRRREIFVNLGVASKEQLLDDSPEDAGSYTHWVLGLEEIADITPNDDLRDRGIVEAVNALERILERLKPSGDPDPFTIDKLEISVPLEGDYPRDAFAISLDVSPEIDGWHGYYLVDEPTWEVVSRAYREAIAAAIAADDFEESKQDKILALAEDLRELKYLRTGGRLFATVRREG